MPEFRDYVPTPLTVVELEALEHPSSDQIIETLLFEYADSASAIRAEAITAAIERANPAERQLLDIQEAAIRGIVAHTARPSGERPLGCSDTTLSATRDQYAQVVGHVGILLGSQSE